MASAHFSKLFTRDQFADLHTGFAIIFSASTYLFDFASTIATVKEYHKIVQAQPSMVGIFIAILCLILVAHTANAAVFKLELRRQERPILAAYLFPLIQLHRLATALWNKCTYKRLKSLKSERKSNLFNLLAVAFETAPQLALQFSVFLVKLGEGLASKVLFVSLFASFLSGTVNGGIAMLSTITTTQEISWRLKAGLVIVAGMSTLAALILECVTVIALILWKGWISPVSFILLQLCIYCTLFYSIILSKEDGAATSGCLIKGKRVVRSLSWAYITMTMGPLYPVASNAKSRGDQLGHRMDCPGLLLLAAGLYLGLDVAVFVLSLAGPQFCRWSYYCVQVFKVPYKHFSCSFYIPTTIFGITAFIISIISYIYLTKYIEGARESSAAASRMSIHIGASVHSSSQNSSNNRARGKISQAPLPEFRMDMAEHQNEEEEDKIKEENANAGNGDAEDIFGHGGRISQAPAGTEFRMDIAEHQNEEDDKVGEEKENAGMKFCDAVQYAARVPVGQSASPEIIPIDDECFNIQGHSDEHNDEAVNCQCCQPCPTQVDVSATSTEKANMHSCSEKSTIVAGGGEIGEVKADDQYLQEKHIGYAHEAPLRIHRTTSMSTQPLNDSVSDHCVVEDEVLMETIDEAVLKSVIDQTHKEPMSSGAEDEYFPCWEYKIDTQTTEDSRFSNRNKRNTLLPAETFNPPHDPYSQGGESCNGPPTSPTNQTQELE